jgi:hypothetical protein
MVGCILQSGPKQRKYHILVYRLEIFFQCPWFLIFPDSTLLYFVGVAIWIFFILPNANDLPSGITSNTALNFTLDGLLVHTYLSPQPNENTPAFQYNVCGYSAEDYSNDNHTMVISTNDYPINTYVNFDYAIYTYVYSVIAPSACGSNINLGLMNPITLPRRLQDLHPPAPQDLQQPIIHRPTT